MLRDLWDVIKDAVVRTVKSRLFAVGAIFFLFFSVLVGRLFYLQIIKGEEYYNQYISKTKRTITTTAPRGNIYDKNGNLLAYNELTYSVTIQDVNAYPKAFDKNGMLYRLVKILDKYDQSVNNTIPVIVNDKGEYEFSGTDSKIRSFIKDVYPAKTIEARAKEGIDVYSYDAETVLSYLSENLYKIDAWMEKANLESTPSKQNLLDMMNIRYAMSATAYTKYKSTVICTDVSDELAAAIKENAPEIQGVDIEEDTMRVYTHPIEFSHILGYTGKASADQLEELKEKNASYEAGDVIGKAGIESAMEEELQGTKGEDTVYLDSQGTILETIDSTPATVGNDVYLSIDMEMQIAAYNIIEQKLAGVLVEKLVNYDYTPVETMKQEERVIPVKDAYFQMINNNVLNMSDFADDDASQVERGIYNKFVSYHGGKLTEIEAELKNGAASTLNQLSDEMREYYDYIYSFLVDDQKIIVSDKVDKDNEVYKRYKSGDASLRELLYEAITSNWLDVSKLETDSKYSSTEQMYQVFVDYIMNSIKNDSGFAKKIYKYLIQNEIITGNEICLALYDQGVLDREKDANEIIKLANGNKDDAYNFMKEKITNLEITPAQLALDPCSASTVVTDANTGEILAMVSYPGYDINRLSGTIDAQYYSQLQNDLSQPFYNRASQTRIAPGSTFKPITAVAGLEEGVIGLNDAVVCEGIFDLTKQTCWIFNQGIGVHGPLTTVQAIAKSCNIYFYELGYRLSLDENGTYNQELGLERLRKYAELFGLGTKTGIEIPESEPKISDELPISSAIGQGTSSFTTVQLSRYVTAIASRGKVYDYTLVSKVADTDGNVIEQFTPEVDHTVDLDGKIWDTLWTGMNGVIRQGMGGSAEGLFASLNTQVAVKSGTAQENKLRASHAHFISFAPYDDPEITVSVSMPNGYTSANAGIIVREFYRYYFNDGLDYDTILNGKALINSIGESAND